MDRLLEDALARYFGEVSDGFTLDFETVTQQRDQLTDYLLHAELHPRHIPEYVLGGSSATRVSRTTECIGLVVAQALRSLTTRAHQRRGHFPAPALDSRHPDKFIRRVMDWLCGTTTGLRVLRHECEELLTRVHTDYASRRASLTPIRRAPRGLIRSMGLPDDDHNRTLAAAWIWLEYVCGSLGTSPHRLPRTRVRQFDDGLDPGQRLHLIDYAIQQTASVAADVGDNNVTAGPRPKSTGHSRVS